MKQRDQAIFALGLMGSIPLALALLTLGWPILFVPGLWRGYTCWETEEDV